MGHQEFATIGDGAVIGAHAVLVGPVKIGRNAMVGSNSVVLTDVPDNAVVFGIPARRVGNRDDRPAAPRDAARRGARRGLTALAWPLARPTEDPAEMAAAHADVVEAIQAFLVRVQKPADLTPETQLYAEGIGLDSLETAELSALLEDEFGADPFSSEEMPQTVGEILAFYDSALASDGLIELLRRADPSRAAVVGDDESHTYGELTARAEHLAAALSDRGIQRLATVTQDAATVVALLAGGSLVGIEVCQYPPTDDPAEVEQLAGRFDHDVVLTDRPASTAWPGGVRIAELESADADRPRPRRPSEPARPPTAAGAHHRHHRRAAGRAPRLGPGAAGRRPDPAGRRPALAARLRPAPVRRAADRRARDGRRATLVAPARAPPAGRPGRDPPARASPM